MVSASAGSHCRIISIVEGTSAAAFPLWVASLPQRQQQHLQPFESPRTPTLPRPLNANGRLYELPFCLSVCSALTCFPLPSPSLSLSLSLSSSLATPKLVLTIYVTACLIALRNSCSRISLTVQVALQLQVLVEVEVEVAAGIEVRCLLCLLLC